MSNLDWCIILFLLNIVVGACYGMYRLHKWLPYLLIWSKVVAIYNRPKKRKSHLVPFNTNFTVRKYSDEFMKGQLPPKPPPPPPPPPPRKIPMMYTSNTGPR